MSTPKFNLGQVVITQGVIALVDKHKLQLFEYLGRHHKGDWGDLSSEDKQANDNAVDSKEAPMRVLSAYKTNGGKIWIITEWDRSVTTILLPSEY